MMQPGDRILLWVGGQSRKYERGIWGDGSVTGETLCGVSSGLVSPYWRTSEIAAQHQNFCQVKITQLLDTAVTDRRLRDAGITDLEVQRQLQGISPSWVTKAQLNGIDKVMAEQPDPVATLARSGGASPSTPTESRRVELAAVREVTAYYVRAGWAVSDVSMLKLGWDLTCTKGRREARVEVKGLRGPRPVIF